MHTKDLLIYVMPIIYTVIWHRILVSAVTEVSIDEVNREKNQKFTLS